MDDIILIILVIAIPCTIGMLIANYIFDKIFIPMRYRFKSQKKSEVDE